MENIRLQALASWISPGDRVLDMGTDHGILPALLKAKYPDLVIAASDNKEGPLSRARKNFSAAGLSIPCFLSDGFDQIPEGYDAIVIAGMGGKAMIRILQRGSAYAEKAEKLLLQPNANVSDVRRYLLESGFAIRDENIVRQGHDYEMILAQYTGKKASYQEEDVLFGPLLRVRKPEAFLRRWEKERDALRQVLDSLPESHPGRQKLAERIRMIDRVLS